MTGKPNRSLSTFSNTHPVELCNYAITKVPSLCHAKFHFFADCSATPHPSPDNLTLPSSPAIYSIRYFSVLNFSPLMYFISFRFRTDIISDIFKKSVGIFFPRKLNCPQYFPSEMAHIWQKIRIF